LSKVAREDGDEIDYGIVTSEGGDFPIVDGILRLHVDEYREPIVERVREKRFSQALTIALDEALFHGRTGAAISLLSRFAFRTGFTGAAERCVSLKRNSARAMTDSGATFAELLEKVSPSGLADWEIYRFSMPTFLPVFPLLHIVRVEGPLLDFGCGMGQASFLISRMWPNTQIVCADYSFCCLYLAKKYFVREANYVCLDGDYLLPFGAGEFSTVFSSDTLHCIDSKLSLTQEFNRVSCEKAVMLLPHLHNRSASPYAKSLTPQGYRELFRGETRVIPEQEVIRDYFVNGALDLAKEWSDEELATSEQGVSIVSSADLSVFKRTEDLWDQRIRSVRYPCINPAYRIAGQSGNWELTRRAGDQYAKTFTWLDKVCLPTTCRVAARSLDTDGLRELQRTDAVQFEQLARTLVVLDLPERFMSVDQVFQHGNSRLTAHAAV
jgi:SAM-dependent methyltransferase